jgi:hypothetical protein
MINRLQIILEQPEYSALIKLSGQELRSPADQVVIIIRNELIRLGLLPPDKLPYGPDPIHLPQSTPKPEEK